VVVLPLTTSQRRGSWHVLLRAGEGGLPVDSVVRCENLAALPKGRLLPTALGGPLAPRRLMEIRAAILRALDYE
jgi:mRNA-degrading endonuclease toxin of MazEF toxin-antitoxin module